MAAKYNKREGLLRQDILQSIIAEGRKGLGEVEEVSREEYEHSMLLLSQSVSKNDEKLNLSFVNEPEGSLQEPRLEMRRTNSLG